MGLLQSTLSDSRTVPLTQHGAAATSTARDQHVHSSKEEKMKIFPKRVLTLLTLTALTVGSALSTTTPFTLTLEAEENPVKAGAEIKIGITLRNSSSRAMYMSLGLSELDY